MDTYYEFTSAFGVGVGRTSEEGDETNEEGHLSFLSPKLKSRTIRQNYSNKNINYVPS